jgi:hypothetical protein
MKFFSNLSHSSNTDFLKNIPHHGARSTFSLFAGFLNGIALNHPFVTKNLFCSHFQLSRNSHILLGKVIFLAILSILATHHLAFSFCKKKFSNSWKKSFSNNTSSSKNKTKSVFLSKLSIHMFLAKAEDLISV